MTTKPTFYYVVVGSNKAGFDFTPEASRSIDAEHVLFIARMSTPAFVNVCKERIFNTLISLTSVIFVSQITSHSIKFNLPKTGI
jgi:hypothetical protein